jgi:hypothetical protein
LPNKKINILQKRKPIKNSLYGEIKNILNLARNEVVRAVNASMVIAYWEIGKRIVEVEQKGSNKADYGDYLLRDLAQKLTEDFGKGFDERELRKMRQFFLMFSIRDAASPESHTKTPFIEQNSGNRLTNQRKLTAIRKELSWTHYRHLMRVDNTKAREYYTNEAADCNWSARIA